MKSILTVCFGLLCSGLMYGQDAKKRVDSVANFYRETFDFNGTVLVTDKGKVLLNNGYGYQNKAKNLLNTTESIYIIGSVTKQFTSEVILILASEEKLKLNDKLSKYFPTYPEGDKITLENMLTHTSGIFDYTQDSAWQASKLNSPITDKQIFSLFWDKPLMFTPGSKMSYSNTNYKLLGLIIEQLTGRSYYQNVREKIFAPLGMLHSGFDFAGLNNKNKTVGYYRVRNDSFLVSIIVDSTQTNAAGSIYSTTGDMLKWHDALQTNKLLNKEWQEKAFVPFKDNYAYGWEIDSLNGKLLLSHSGFIHGYNANFYRFPSEDACIVVFTNLMKTGADPIAFSRDLARAMYDPEYIIPEVRKEIRLPESVKKQYIGTYTLVEDTSLHFDFTFKNNQLFLQVTGQPVLPLLPQSKTMFFTKVVDAQIEFKKDDSGEYSMILHQGGQDLEGHKMKK